MIYFGLPDQKNPAGGSGQARRLREHLASPVEEVKGEERLHGSYSRTWCKPTSSLHERSLFQPISLTAFATTQCMSEFPIAILSP